MGTQTVKVQAVLAACPVIKVGAGAHAFGLGGIVCVIGRAGFLDALHLDTGRDDGVGGDGDVGRADIGDIVALVEEFVGKRIRAKDWSGQEGEKDLGCHCGDDGVKWC